ncbi:membrane protein [Gordonia phage Hollow]|nr:membrane protein [Gordonia phage Hollow]
MPYSELRHDSRNPFQWAVIAGIWAYSIVQILTDTWPGQIEQNTNQLFRWMWGGTLTLGATLALVGMSYSIVLSQRKLGNKTPKGLPLEAGGLYWFGLCLGVYAITLVANGKASAVLAAIMFSVAAAAAIIRGVWIQRGLRRVGRGEPASGKTPVLPRE